MSQPTLETTRLVLRPFTLSDAAEVQRLAGAREVALGAHDIPHPYPDGVAEWWIGKQPSEFEQGIGVTFAIVRRDDGALLGGIGLRLNHREQHAEMGYWMGVPYWSQGYGTEAATALVRYGFTDLDLHRIYANHYTRNPASGRIMQKIGMQHEGRMREHARHWDGFEDLELYGLLRSEWQASQGG